MGGGGGRGSLTGGGGKGMPGSPAPHEFPMLKLKHIGTGAGAGGGGGGAAAGGAVLVHGGRDLDRARTVGAGVCVGETLGLEYEYDDCTSVGVTGSRTVAFPSKRTELPLPSTYRNSTAGAARIAET